MKRPLVEALGKGVRKFVVDAPTGSGKSTRLPLMLAENLGGKILVLQPRRVAARLLAKFVAQSVGSKAGDFAGWHIRLDKNFSADTKIIFLTEGILARMLIADPKLKGVSAIVFDEFHERNIFSDISFALALESAKTHRPDLVLMLCSASMDSARLMENFGEGAVKLECESRLFPIDVQYSPVRGRDEKIWDRAAIEFDRLAKENADGDFLIFMPGAYEISRTISALSKFGSARKFEIVPLHGSMNSAMQDRAVSASDRRKVVVATNIAETSLTIPGVKFVIDSGLARVARYDAARGVNTLLTERISVANAVQRSGRAGRTAPGLAVRLWRQSEEADFELYMVPEILRLDLSQIILWLKSADLKIENLALLDFPAPKFLERANRLLHELGALDKNEKITDLGLAMGRFPAEPRYARMLIEAARRNCIDRVALWAAVAEAGRIRTDALNERMEFVRDEMLEDPVAEPDELAQLCEIACANNYDERFCRDYGIHGVNARRAFEIATDLKRVARVCVSEKFDVEKDCPHESAKSILSAFSDHLCVRLNEGTLACAIVGGRRGEARRESKKYASKLFTAFDLNEQNVGGRVSVMASLLCPVEKSYLAELFPEDFSESESALFDERLKRMVSVRRTMFRDLPIEESFGDKVSEEESAKTFCALIMDGTLKLKNWGEAEEDFIERVNFVAALSPESEIAAIDDDAKRAIFEQLCHGVRSYSDVKNTDVMPHLRDWLSAEQLALLDYLAPRFVELPKRNRPVKIRYDAALKRAYVASKFSDFYDFDQRKIKIADGKIPPTFEILAPNGRPVQLTQNLDEFWKTSWPSIMKELRARYPKHFKDMPKT